jgi:multicomponent Na+:H+ antiporter subunit E
MSHDGGVAPARRTTSAIARATALLAFWMMLAGAAVADLPAAAVAVGAATWTSLCLWPPGPARLRLAPLPGLTLRFLWQSVVAGWDVATRALAPRPRVRPGFAVYPVGLPPGPARNCFTTLTSLLPGTVPAGEVEGGLLYHCLDVEQPVVAQLAAEEAELARVIGGAPPRA